MRPALRSSAFAGPAPTASVLTASVLAMSILAMPTASSAAAATCSAHHHLARLHRHTSVARYGQAFYIPRFSQTEAEAEVHTAYPYRTGLYAPWPDF